MYNHILQNRVSRVQSVEMREGRGQTFWDGTQSGTHRVKQTSAVKEAKRVHWSRKINRLSMQRSLSQSCCNKHFFCPANQSIKLSTQSKQSVLSRCRHFQFRTSKLNVQAIRKVQGDRTPHPSETAARLLTEPCKQKPLSRDWYKAADMWTSLLMQPPGLKAMPIFSSPLLLHKVRIDEKGVDPVESNDGQGNVMGGRNPFFSVVNVQMVVPSILAGTHPKYFCNALNWIPITFW